MKDGATKVVQTEEIPSSTKEHFDMVTAAILSNIGNYCALAIEAEYKPAILKLGAGIMELLNSSLAALDGQKKTMEN